MYVLMTWSRDSLVICSDLPATTDIVCRSLTSLVKSNKVGSFLKEKVNTIWAASQGSMFTVTAVAPSSQGDEYHNSAH